MAGSGLVGCSAVKPAGKPLALEMVNVSNADGSKVAGLITPLFRFNTNSASDISPSASTVVSPGTKTEGIMDQSKSAAPSQVMVRRDVKVPVKVPVNVPVSVPVRTEDIMPWREVVSGMDSQRSDGALNPRVRPQMSTAKAAWIRCFIRCCLIMDKAT